MTNDTDLIDDNSALHDMDLNETVPAELSFFLAAAAGPPSAPELAGEGAAVAAFAAAGIRSIPTPISAGPRRRVLARRGAIAAVAAFSLAGASAAAAATGSLPGAARDVARTSLTKVGVDVPRGKGKGLATAPGQLKTKDKPAKATKPPKTKGSKPADGADPQGPPASTKGATISSIAQMDYPNGAARGAAVSNAASEGKSHAGEDHPATPKPEAAGPPASSPGATAPGRATASTAGNRAGAGQPPKAP